MNKGFLVVKSLSRSFRTSAFAQAKIIEVVPALGESITEGSISKWMKNVGEKLNVDDVVVVVETDKVTVDIKSNHAGVLTKQLSLDTVIVGKDLYEIDTEGTPSVAAVSTATPVANNTHAQEAVTVATTETAHESHARKPSIKFIGKRKHVKIDLNVPYAFSANKASSEPKPSKPQTGVTFTTLKNGAFFGRPVFSVKEIEAIESGGAC